MRPDTTTTPVPETRQPGYWELAGQRVREVLATSPAAAGHLIDMAIVQNQPFVVTDLLLGDQADA